MKRILITILVCCSASSVWAQTTAKKQGFIIPKLNFKHKFQNKNKTVAPKVEDASKGVKEVSNAPVRESTRLEQIKLERKKLFEQYKLEKTHLEKIYKEKLNKFYGMNDMDSREAKKKLNAEFEVKKRALLSELKKKKSALKEEEDVLNGEAVLEEEIPALPVVKAPVVKKKSVKKVSVKKKRRIPPYEGTGFNKKNKSGSSKDKKSYIKKRNKDSRSDKNSKKNNKAVLQDRRNPTGLLQLKREGKSTINNIKNKR